MSLNLNLLYPDDSCSFIIRISGYILSNGQPSSNQKLKFKALVDTGARMNCINSLLVPASCQMPSSLTSITTAVGKKDTPYQCEVQLYLTEEKWIKINAIVFYMDYGLILGSPILALLHPNGLKKKNDKFGFQFTMDKEKVFFPFIKKAEPNVLHKIEDIQDHIVDLQKDRE